MRKHFLYRVSDDPEVVPTERVRAIPPRSDLSVSLSGHVRWLIIRTNEAMVASGPVSLSLVLSSLNRSLVELNAFLSSPIRPTDYVLGFNRLDNSNSSRKNIIETPPFALLLVLLGLPDDQHIPIKEYSEPSKYPDRPPVWLAAGAPPHYENWGQVFDRVASRSKANPNDTLGCDTVEAALHLIRDAVVVEKGNTVDLYRYGSGIYLAQYGVKKQQPGSTQQTRQWLTTESLLVYDYRPRDLPLPHDNSPTTDIDSSSGTFVWTWGNVRVVVGPAGRPIRLITTASYGLPSYGINPGDPFRRKTVAARLEREGLSWGMQLATEGRSAGDMRFLSRFALEHFVGHLYSHPDTPVHLGDALSAPGLETHEDADSIIVVAEVLHHAGKDGPWRPPVSCGSVPIAVTETPDLPGFLLFVDIIVSIARVAPTTPTPKLPEYPATPKTSDPRPIVPSSSLPLVTPATPKSSPTVTTTTATTISPPPNLVSQANETRIDAEREARRLLQSVNSTYDLTKRRYGGIDDRDIRREIGNAEKPYVDVLSRRWDEATPVPTPEQSIEASQAALEAVKAGVETSERLLVVVANAETEALTEYSKQIQKASRFTDDRKALAKMALVGAVVIPEPVKEPAFGVKVSDLIEAVTDPGQARSIATLRSTAGRLSSPTDKEIFIRIARDWEQELATALVGLRRLEAVGKIPDDADGEAFLQGTEQLKRVTLTPPMAYPIPATTLRWPTDVTRFRVAELINEANIQWLNAVRERIQEELSVIYLRYERAITAFRTELQTKDEEPDGSPASRGKLGAIAVSRLVVSIVPRTDGASEFLREAIAMGSVGGAAGQPRAVFDRIRKSFLDCAIIHANTIPAEQAAQRWDELQKEFERVRAVAQRLEDYFKAFVDMVAGESGWCAYAYKRHWIYDTEDSARAVFISGDTARWRAFTRWSSTILSKDEGDTNGPKSATQVKPSDESALVSKAEEVVLKSIEDIWKRAWESVMKDKVLHINNPRGVVKSPQLRFVQLGNNIEECWRNLERDPHLYEGIVNFLLPPLLSKRGWTADDASGIFLRATWGLLGLENIPEPGKPFPELPAETGLVKSLTKLESIVLHIFMDGLQDLEIWPSIVGAPRNWWHGNCRDLAYEPVRPINLLTPDPLSGDDDFHGATIAISEFVAFGKPGLWDSYNTLHGRQTKRPVAVSRPTCIQMEQSAMEALAMRYRRTAGESTVLSKWIGRLWSEGELRRIVGLSRTFGRMVATSDADGTMSLRLAGDLGPNNMEKAWSLSRRITPILDPSTEAYELSRALAAEIGSLVYGAAVSTSGRSQLLPRAGVRQELVAVLDSLVRYLTNDQSSSGTPYQRFLGWVYQDDASVSSKLIVNVKSPVQWTIAAQLLLGGANVPVVGGSTNTVATRPSSAMALDYQETLRRLPDLVNALEGDSNSYQGTCFHPPKRISRLYNPNRFDNEHVAIDGEDALYRVAWPLALGQTINARYRRLSVSDSASLPPMTEVLDFLYSHLLRNDTEQDRPVPFFVAAVPENPDKLHSSGFSADAIAAYLSSSAYRIEVDVITPLDGLRLGALEKLAAAEGLTFDVTTGALTAYRRILGNNLRQSLRTMFHIDVHVDDTVRLAMEGFFVKRLGPVSTERAIYTFTRKTFDSITPPSSRVEDSEWRLLSGWLLPEETTGEKALVDLLPIQPYRVEDTVPGTRSAPYLNPLYPLRGQSHRRDELYTRYTYERGTQQTRRTDIYTNWGQLHALCPISSIMTEKRALVDWYRQLMRLEQSRRLKSDYVAVLNGDGSFLQALRRTNVSDAIGVEVLETARIDLLREWDTFEERAKALFKRFAYPRWRGFHDTEELHTTRLKAWRVDWEISLTENYGKSRTKIDKIISKRLNETDIRVRIDEVVRRFIYSSKVDVRKRAGWLDTLVALETELKERQIPERHESLELVLNGTGLRTRLVKAKK